MTAAELDKLVGMKATVPVRRGLTGTVEIQVRIMETRNAYGREELRIEPVAGSGTAWVTVDRVKVKGA